MSLMRPDFPGGSCCGPTDQVYVDEYESNEPTGGFIAIVGGNRLVIPANKVIWDRVNPTGRGVLFYTHYDEQNYTIFCFVPGMGT